MLRAWFRVPSRHPAVGCPEPRGLTTSVRSMQSSCHDGDRQDPRKAVSRALGGGHRHGFGGLALARSLQTDEHVGWLNDRRVFARSLEGASLVPEISIGIGNKFEQNQ